MIVANLAAKDWRMDLLAYNLVMSALTLASEGLPSALAVLQPNGGLKRRLL